MYILWLDSYFFIFILFMPDSNYRLAKESLKMPSLKPRSPALTNVNAAFKVSVMIKDEKIFKGGDRAEDAVIKGRPSFIDIIQNHVLIMAPLLQSCGISNECIVLQCCFVYVNHIEDKEMINASFIFFYNLFPVEAEKVELPEIRIAYAINSTLRHVHPSHVYNVTTFKVQEGGDVLEKRAMSFPPVSYDRDELYEICKSFYPSKRDKKSEMITISKADFELLSEMKELKKMKAQMLKENPEGGDDA